MFRKHIYLTVGAVLFATGVTMYLIGTNIPLNICYITGGASNLYQIEPSKSYACTFKNQSLESDLSLNAYFYDNNGNGREINFLTNAQIIDPSGSVLQNVNFTDKVSISVKPQTIGDYRTVLTFLDEGNKKYDNVHTGMVIDYGFANGYNLLNNLRTSLMVIGNILYLAGFIFLVYAGIKLIRDKRNSFDSQRS
jgi:hypothetical protein